MKKALLLIITFIFCFSSSVEARHVSGYKKRNGTYVKSYQRTKRDSNILDLHLINFINY